MSKEDGEESTRGVYIYARACGHFMTEFTTMPGGARLKRTLQSAESRARHLHTKT